jgi:RHS repeat-associated protein
LNRLKDATYQKSNLVTRMYDENLTYDKNGNIMTLKRNGDNDAQTGTFAIDNLGYAYATNSNKLMSVTDTPASATSGFKDGNTTGDDYVYDANGNMTVDKNKKITSIVYNHLNLPTKIVFPTGNIVYIYNASGQKVQKVVTENTTVTTTDYLGGYQYKNTVLQFFPTAEGYVKNTPVSGTNTYSYVFNYTDHLGNVRLSYTKNPSTNVLTILDENNYYPFGLMHKGYNNLVSTNNPAEKLLYNGKELQDELGLDMYDFGARMLDRQLGIWRTVDPKAETSRRFSPYAYALNNPVYFIDPDGMQAIPPDWFVNNETGAIVHVEGQSKLTQATADKIGAGDAKKYDRLGADNMFGNNEAANKVRGLGASVVENPEKFMNEQGYDKAEKVKIVEKEYTSGGKIGEESISSTHSTLTQIGDSKVTYAKSENLNSKTNVKEGKSESTYSNIETTSYTLTKPYGQENTQTAVYGSKETSNNLLKPLQIIGDLVEKFLSK